MGRRCRDRLQLRFPHGRELEWADSDSSSFRPEREDFFQDAAAVAEEPTRRREGPLRVAHCGEGDPQSQPSRGRDNVRRKRWGLARLS